MHRTSREKAATNISIAGKVKIKSFILIKSLNATDMKLWIHNLEEDERKNTMYSNLSNYSIIKLII